MSKLKRTIKEREFIKAYIDLKGNATKAYLKVFPQVKKSSGAVLGANLLKKINLKMTEMLNLIGVTDHVLSEKLKEGLNAKLANGKPNFYVRARYMDMAYKLKAHYPIDETRLKLPGTSGITSVTLKEIIYGKDGKSKLSEKVGIAQIEHKKPENEENGENVPF